MSTPFLSVEDLRVDIPGAAGTAHVVRNVGFTLEKGETLGIVGESGSGKSMTALALLGLLPKRAVRSAYRLALGDYDLLSMSDRDLATHIRGNRVSMIFQEPMTSLNPVYTIGRQLTEVMALHRNVSQREARERAVYLLDKVGITAAASRMHQYPHQLSGGQRQRVMIAMALMNEPELVIADEPTTALDVTIQAQILRLLAELQRELGMAMILITHNLGVVARIADRVAIMYGGEIVETARTAQLFSNPRHPYTRGLLACVPEAASTGPGERLAAIPGMVPSLIGEIRGCAFANRCAYAQEQCRASAIPLRVVDDETTYRCVLEDRLPQSAASATGAGAIGLSQEHPASAPLLSVENVRCSFMVGRGLFRPKQPLHAVNGVTLDLAKGDILAVVGESGCGKSTLARILLGLQPVDAGEVRFDGKPLSSADVKAITRRVQPIFQDPYSSLNPRQTVEDIIRRPLDLHAIGAPQERRAAVASIMDLVGLPRRMAHSYPNQISGGQRQRVAIARAIIMRPEIVICDEPTSALDVSVQSQILNLLLDLRDELGLTYLLISHDLSVVRHMATRVAVMYLGRIVETGPTAALFAAPRHPYTRALLQSAMTVTPGAGVPDIHLGSTYPNPLDMPTGCAFHPRCPEAMPICSSALPEVAGTTQALVCCHLHTDRRRVA